MRISIPFPCSHVSGLLLAGFSIGLGLACGGGKQAQQPVDRVYVAGYASTGIEVGNSIPNQAMLWVDGKATRLSPGSPSFANGLAVVGSDTYVVGKCNGSEGKAHAVVWNNGNVQPLADPDGSFVSVYPTSVAVSNGTVVVGGDVTLNASSFASLWVNGALQAQANDPGRLEGVAILDGQVVAAGWIDDQVQVGPNSVWIRPSPVILVGKEAGVTRLTSGLIGGEINGICVNAGNVLVAGSVFQWNSQAMGASPTSLRPLRERVVQTIHPRASSRCLQTISAYDVSLPQVATYWKNGKAVYLSDGTRGACCSAICTQGQDIYVSGLQQVNDSYDAAVYWKNGVMVPLTQGKSEARTTGIAVVGTDIYVSGYEVINGICVATYWKNGVAVRLTDGECDSFARGIVVQRLP